MRVHELAKATGLESKDILAIAKRHRVAVKPNPSANIEDKDVRKLYPLIEKYKAEQRVKDEENKRKKEEERKHKEEERKRKEEQERVRKEEERKHKEEERKRKEEEVRLEAQRKAEEERRRRDEEERKRREEESRRRSEEQRMRTLGFRVPAQYGQPVSKPATPPAEEVASGTEQSAGASVVESPPAPPAGPAPEASPGPAAEPPAASPGQPVRPEPGGSRDLRTQRPDGPPRQGGYPQRGEGGGYQSRQGQGGYPPRQGQGGGYQPRQGQGGGYQPRQGQGGYPPRQGQGGGYQPRQGQGGYPPRQGQGGYQPRPGGGYQPRGPRPQGQRDDRGPRPPYDRQQDRGPRPQGAPREPGQKPRLTEDNLPQIGVMRLDKPQQRRGTDKDKKPAKGRVDKNKPKPSRIFELDEDMTITSRPKTVGGKQRPVPQLPGARRPHYRGSRKTGRGDRSESREGTGMSFERARAVRLQGETTLAQFAEKAGLSSAEIIKKLMLLGEMVSLNQVLSAELMELIAPEFGIELEIVREGDEYDVAQYVVEDNVENMIRRPPVVTIMGHVDHGKTTLLDWIRKSKVVEDEFGGITQHIGAYHVETSKGEIVFLDTPGHEAFTSMRARGASVTDLVILVVAANDGFKPQTIEAVHHAQAAKVPIVIAVNKIDLPGADPQRVRQEALQHNLVPEEFGGDTIFVDIAAKKGTNVEQLLEMVALQAEILDLKADPDRPAQGVIVESHVDPQRGAVATVLVQKGTLNEGDFFVAGDISGRVRAMVDDHGRAIESAGPSFPAEILGLTGSPSAGEMFLVVPDDRVARDIAEKREVRRRLAGLAPTTQKHITLEGLHEFIEEGKVKELNVILKGDVQGSIEAISQSLEKLSTMQVRIRILHAAVGGINDSDVNLAIASDAVIIGFNVRPDQSASELAEREEVEIKLYRIIYDLLQDIRNAMTGMLEPKFREKILGHVEIKQLFKISRIGTVAGCLVRDGEVTRDSKIRLVRDNVVIYEGQLSSLRRFKEDAKRVQAGVECGLSIENYNDLKEGDVVEAFEMEQIAATLGDPLNP